jgi:biotin transport system substrate-specific component
LQDKLLQKGIRRNEKEKLMKKRQTFKDIALISAFTALITIGAKIQIPFIPVPIVLANFFVVLAGTVLGPKRGGLSILLYLFLGLIFVPVFSGPSAGPAYFVSPTAGYLFGYLLGAVVSGVIVNGHEKTPALVIIGTICGFLAIYAVGFPVLLLIKGTFSWPLLAGGLLNPLIGDSLKAAAIILIVLSSHSLYKPLTGDPSGPASA